VLQFLKRLRSIRSNGPGLLTPKHVSEVEHWSQVESQARSGARLFWLNHPRVAKHYYDKAEIDGVSWRRWLTRTLGRPANLALELGCGSGTGLVETWNAGAAVHLVGLDLEESRFNATLDLRTTAGARVDFIAADANELQLDEGRYDLIYSVQSLHHFERLERIMAEVRRALTSDGFFVLDEFVGPARFQWTDLQLSLTAQLLGLMPANLRKYSNGTEKACEGRSTVEQVIQVCPSEAIRSDEIVRLFYDNFHVVQHKNLGGTIQHLLYSGIVQNFPDDDPAVDRMIDCIDALETTLIERQAIPSDFALLIGKR
jgi:O-antigen biosynthesis protein